MNFAEYMRLARDARREAGLSSPVEWPHSALALAGKPGDVVDELIARAEQAQESER